jgi:hypothetical protein
VFQIRVGVVDVMDEVDDPVLLGLGDLIDLDARDLTIRYGFDKSAGSFNRGSSRAAHERERPEASLAPKPPVAHTIPASQSAGTPNFFCNRSPAPRLAQVIGG